MTVTEQQVRQVFGRVETAQRDALAEYQKRLAEQGELERDYELCRMRALASSTAKSAAAKNQEADVASGELKARLGLAKVLTRSAKAALDVAEREHSARQSWVSMVKAEAYVSR